MSSTMSKVGLMRAMLLALVMLAGCVPAPRPGQDEPEQAIRTALLDWTGDFNAGRQERICDLFATELRYDYGAFPERGHRAICDLLHRSLDDPERRYRYDLEIKEILVSGDLAVVRLAWTLEVSERSTGETLARSTEPGMDVFRRQPDGGWKIIRYLAYEIDG